MAMAVLVSVFLDEPYFTIKGQTFLGSDLQYSPNAIADFHRVFSTFDESPLSIAAILDADNFTSARPTVLLLFCGGLTDCG